MTVPLPVPAPILTGTPTPGSAFRSKCLLVASFGVQGAFVAELLSPLPLMCRGPPTRWRSSPASGSLRLGSA